MVAMEIISIKSYYSNEIALLLLYPNGDHIGKYKLSGFQIMEVLTMWLIERAEMEEFRRNLGLRRLRIYCRR